MIWTGEVVAVHGDVIGGERYFRVTLTGTRDARAMELMVTAQTVGAYAIGRRVKVTTEPLEPPPHA